ncbi:MAG: sodium/solute symporter [Verrucomicrobiales bacterium]|nr:sodium/solute symporter [Verrucomicrobiales bacterium]
MYATATVFLGWYFGKRQKSTAEYFTGSGKMNPMLIGVSLVASLLSTITYLSLPGEVTGKGPVYLVQYLAYPFIFLIVGFVLLPVYMKQRVTSAYELLEENLGVGARLLGATMFLLLRLVWMSLLIFAAAKAFSYIAGIDRQYIPIIVVVAGAISLFYASMGGLRAVVITDLMQTILLYGGALMVIIIVSIEMKGFSWFPTEWQENWDKDQPFFPTDLKTRVSWIGTIISVLVWYVATSGGDQVSIQRFMATKDAKAARKSIGLQLIVALIVGVTLGFAGFAMLGYFQANPQLLPEGFSLKTNADDVFPRFIGYHLPTVVAGLVTAGLFAAAMSSMDSGVNSITAVVSSDFVDRFRKTPLSEEQHIRFARILAVVIGVIVIIGSSLIQHVPGNITATTGKTVNLLTVPIFCLFVFALFFKRATPAGVWVGWFCGTTVAASIAFSGPIVTLLATKFGVDPATFGVALETVTDSKTGEEVTRAPDPVSFQWIGPAALVVNLSVGWLVSLLTGRRKGKMEG